MVLHFRKTVRIYTLKQLILKHCCADCHEIRCICSSSSENECCQFNLWPFSSFAYPQVKWQNRPGHQSPCFFICVLHYGIHMLCIVRDTSSVYLFIDCSSRHFLGLHGLSLLGHCNFTNFLVCGNWVYYKISSIICKGFAAGRVKADTVITWKLYLT